MQATPPRHASSLDRWLVGAGLVLALVLPLGAGGCSQDPEGVVPGDVDAGRRVDAGQEADAQVADAGDADAEVVDAGESADAEVVDAGEADAEVADAGESADAGALDAGAPDAGPECGGDARLGMACDPENACEEGRYECSAEVVVCVGTGILRAATHVCRPSAGSCDVAETCDGSSSNCPTDVSAAAGSMCSGGSCDAAGSCVVGCFQGASCSTGNACELGTVDCASGSAVCVSAGPVAAGTTCRAALGPCDEAELCTGTAVTCPADTFVAVGTTCRATAGACDVAEVCTGTTAACPADGFVATAVSCRSAAGPCDVEETCSGVDAACPADALRPSTYACRASGGACDAAETCSGTGVGCPVDTGTPTAPSGFRSGTGSLADPYLICDCSQLQNVTNAPSRNFSIASDIDCAASAGWNAGLGFAPIATFTGRLDGAHHVITDLFIHRPSADNVALLAGLAGSGTVTALGLVRPNITGGNDVGAVVGYVTDSGWSARPVLQYVFTSDAVVRGQNFVGGLIGNEFGTLLHVEDSYFCGSVVGATDYVGGLSSTLYAGSPSGAGARGLLRNTYVCGSIAGPRVGAAFSYAWELDLQNSFSVATLPSGRGLCLSRFGGGATTASFYAGASAAGGCGMSESGGAASFASTGHPVYSTWDFTSVWTMGPAGLPLLRGFSTTP